MKRKLIQTNLRLRASERSELAEAARKHRTSFNGMVVGLAMNALRQEVLLDAQQILENAARGVLPLLGNLHELNVSGDYRRAVGKLTALLRPLLATLNDRDAEAILAVMDEIDAAERSVEVELGRRLRQMHT